MSDSKRLTTLADDCGDREDQLRHRNLLNEVSVTNDGLDSITQRLREKRPRHQHAEKKYGVVGDAKTENSRKNYGQHQHHQCWVEQGPQKAQNRSLIPNFEFFLSQGPNQLAVAIGCDDNVFQINKLPHAEQAQSELTDRQPGDCFNSNKILKVSSIRPAATEPLLGAPW